MTRLTGDELPNEHLKFTKILKLYVILQGHHIKRRTYNYSMIQTHVKLFSFLEIYVTKLTLVF